MSFAQPLRIQVLLEAIDKAKGPLMRIGQAGKVTAKDLRGTLDELRKLKQQQQGLEEFRKGQEAIKDTSAQLSAMKRRVIELREAGRDRTALLGPTYAKDLAKAEQAVGSLNRQLVAQVNTVRDLKGRLSTLGLDQVVGAEERLAQALAKANAQADAQREKIKAIGAAEKRLAETRKLAGNLAMTGIGATAAGAAALGPVGKVVSNYTSLETAMLGVAKQVNGARGPNGELSQTYYDIRRQVFELSKQLPYTTNQIAEMVAAGARMEVPTDQLAEYTRQAAMMATAFDAVPEHLAEQMGKVAKNFQIPVVGVKSLADSINYLDDNAISKGDEIIDVLNRISGVVSTVAMSAKDAAALSSTLLTLGERPETAATAVNAIVQKFAAAEKGAKKFQEAMAGVGLNSHDVQSGMSKDATGTLLRVIEAIRKLPEAKRVGVMVELVGLEHSDTLAKLVTKPEELRRQLGLANGAGAIGSMEREFSARMDTIAARWILANNRMFAASALMGESIRPEMVRTMEVMSGFLDRVSALVAAHPVLTAVLVGTTAAMGGLLAVTGSILLAIASVLGPLALVRYSMSRLGIELIPAAKSLGNWALSLGWVQRTLSFTGAGLARFGMILVDVLTAFRAHPVVFAITTVVATLWYLWENWDKVKALMTQSWDVFTSVIGGNIDGLIHKINLLSQTAKDLLPGWMKWGALGITLRAANGLAGFLDEPSRPVTPMDTRKPLPATGAGAGRGGINPPTTQHFHIYPSQGMNENDLAKKVQQQMDEYYRFQAARQRSSLRDRD